MADFSKAQSKKKKPSRFGTPPAIDEAGDNLNQPEHAPAFSPTPPEGKSKAKPAIESERTVPFGFKVSKKFSREFKKVALEDDLKLVELLEASFEAYKILRHES
uniref:Uncharacterized protein n=1 Tax=Candidatus Kentrum sp. FM TaxID=2126340 RepID=A0A450T882_9GAMM|nr:MAG: hypothetical protein BECKFM1743C_GA0114222_103183 [Candidatus Kentron sp. FM]VFJ62969.1 MAG: hypothetical protein BECKFM1743A_GA0114220_103203 [Candidatus Kentron sp. FM]VFK14310.1 MAG: hypothetical protein BECKFM1743B_GA0114221_103153 [Candidatus Kentron sp. FM]